MEAKQNSVFKFMQQQDTQFVIPVYQRNYDWRNEQCQQLMKDILTVGAASETQSHFVGSVVYLQTSITSNPTFLTIIDGQQRLTTLTLIWIALQRRAHEWGNERMADEIRKKFLINEYQDEGARMKLRPIKKDERALRYLLGSDRSEWTGGFSRLIENFQYFYNSITLEALQTVRKGVEKLVFIDVALERGKDDPQRIFQSLNSTGLDLSQADLIRNYVLLDLDPKKQDAIYENYWAKIEENTQEQNRKESRLSDFIRDYLTFKFRDIPNKDKVFVTFKAKYPINNEVELEALLQDLRSYSVWYGRLLNPQTEPNEAIREGLHLINRVSTTVAYPFLLEVFRDYSDGKGSISAEEVVRVLELVQSFTFRRFLCDLPTNALNKIFATLYRDVLPDQYLPSLEASLVQRQGKHRFPTDDEIERQIAVKDMYNVKSHNRTYFFERLENHGQRIKAQVEGNSDVTIEHIFPQRPGAEWEKELGAELEEMKSLMNTAANLTLSAFNSSLSNRPFREKRDMPEKGYKASTLRLDKFLANLERWDLDALQQRRQQIIDRCKIIWSYPQEAANAISAEQQLRLGLEFDILDIAPDDATSKKIAWASFEGKVLESPSYRELYLHVCRVMFQREPHIFFNLDRQGKLWVRSDPRFFRTPLKISDTYYVEANLSARDIILRIQAILEACETDDQLILQFES